MHALRSDDLDEAIRLAGDFSNEKAVEAMIERIVTDGKLSRDERLLSLCTAMQKTNIPVPLPLEEAALRHILSKAPGNARSSAALANNLRKQGKEVSSGLAYRASVGRYEMQREAGREGGHDVDSDQTKYLSALARELIIAAEADGQPTIDGVLADAFLYDPGEGPLSSFFARLKEVAPPQFIQRVAKAASDACPNSGVALHYYVTEVFEAGDAKTASHMLEQKAELVKEHDFLAQLYMKSLNAEGRVGDASNFTMKFFETYQGDLWRTPNFKALQKSARDRGIPPVLVLTMPKSGSLFILNTLQRGLDAPTTYLRPLALEKMSYIIPSRLRDFAMGGAVCIEHIDPVSANLKMLGEYGIKRAVYNMRDPRQMTLSWIHHLQSSEARIPQAHLEERRQALAIQSNFEEWYLDYYFRWCRFCEEWLRVIEAERSLEILVTDFDDLKSSERRFFGNVLKFFEIDPDKFDMSVLKADKAERAGHFRKGLAREWESVLSAPTLARMDPILAKFPRTKAYVARKDGAAS